MTNGEMIQKVFDCEVCEPIIEDDIIHVIFADKKDSAIGFDWSWWNAEYKEPTAKNNLALINTEGLDEEIRCTMCTNSMKSDRGCDGSCAVNKDMYKAVMDAIEKRIQLTTRNDIAQERYQDLIEYFGGEDTVLKDRKEFKAWLERAKWHIKRADELARELEQLKGTTKNDLPHCQYSDEEIAKSFIEDVEAVKDQLPCGEQMDFPDTFDEFAKDYGFKEKDEVYTNGSELIPVFRVKQWLKHISTAKNDIRFNGVKDELNRVKNELDSTTKNDCAEQNGCITCSLDDGDDCCRKLYEESMQELTTKNDLGVNLIDQAELLKAMDTCDKFGNDPNEGLILLKTPALQDRYVPYVKYDDMVNCVEGMPSVTPQEPKTGHWIEEKNDHEEIEHWHCSNCYDDSGFITTCKWDFCPNCGADMREVEE